MIATTLTYRERAPYCASKVAQQLLRLLDEKQTNLALSADVTRAEQLLTLADQLGPDLAILKTHIDIIEDFTPALTAELQHFAHKHQFLLFEDRKFADIGHTVKHQYEGGIYRIVEWADIVNAHALPGPGIVEGLQAAGLKKERGLLLLAEMSSAGHLMNSDYVQATLTLAEQFPAFVFGFITQHALSPHPHWLNLTPGVKLEGGNDALGQQYVTPEQAILKNGTDVIIVGRGILSAPDPIATAKKYRQHGWEAYLKRCGKA